MPLDKAIYVPAPVDKIFGAMGGYLIQFNATTGAKESSLKVISPVDGPCSLCLHSDGNIYMGGGYDQAWVDTNNCWVSVAGNLYPINPATLTIGAQVDVVTLFDGSFEYQDCSNSNVAVIDMVSDGDYIYYATRNIGSNGGGLFYRINPAIVAQRNGSYQYFTNTNGSALSSFVIDGVSIVIPQGGRWIIQPKDFSGGGFPPEITLDNTQDEYVYSDVVVGTNAYGVGRSWLFKAPIANFSGSHAYSNRFSMLLVEASCRTYRIRYDGGHLLYIPFPNKDKIAVWDTNTDALSVLKTGFDNPIDVVFTPTKVFAVQRGPTGLKEIV